MKKKIVIVVVVILVVFILAVIYSKWNQKRKSIGPIKGGVKVYGGGGPVAAASFPLKRGFKGATVRELQQLINTKCTQPPYSLLVVDGDFGPLTAAAADRCFRELTGHVAEQVSYAEFQNLKNR